MAFHDAVDRAADYEVGGKPEEEPFFEDASAIDFKGRKVASSIGELSQSKQRRLSSCTGRRRSTEEAQKSRASVIQAVERQKQQGVLAASSKGFCSGESVFQCFKVLGGTARAQRTYATVSGGAGMIRLASCSCA